MMVKMIMKPFKILSLLSSAALAVLLCSCQKYAPDVPQPESRMQVMLLYADGFNNLTGAMRADINDLAKKAPLPQYRDKYAMLAFAHFTASNYDYRTPCSPVLINLYKDSLGNSVRDTLKVYPDTCNTSSIRMVRQVLSDIAALYPDAEYGMIYSSHGTGWVPEEYYSASTSSSGDIFNSARFAQAPSGVVGRLDLFEDPLTKSLGCQAWYSGSTLRTHEMDVRSLSEAFPIHLKYFIIDACLMGGVETCYELRSKCDNVICSAVEILSNGFDYANLPDRLLYSTEPDYKTVCDDFLSLNSQGTAAWIKCGALDGLAAACQPLFNKYRTEIKLLDKSSVQCYGRSMEGKEHYWYFDLRDIVAKAGADSPELESLDAALEACVGYKTASSAFLGLQIKNYCGLSMNMPGAVTELNDYYKGYSWNTASSLVQ